jgi:hypothetical protein
MSSLHSYPGPRGGSGRGWTVAAFVIGALALAAGILLSVVPLHQGTITQWNGLCSSGVGQLGQLLSPAARRDCGVVGVADHAIGWLLGLGIAALAAGTLLAIRSRRRPGPAAAPCIHCG